jgi:hypothetical protein
VDSISGRRVEEIRGIANQQGTGCDYSRRPDRERAGSENLPDHLAGLDPFTNAGEPRERVAKELLQASPRIADPLRGKDHGDIGVTVPDLVQTDVPLFPKVELCGGSHAGYAGNVGNEGCAT